STGANIKFGVPFSEVDRVFFGIGVERNGVEVYNSDGWKDSPDRFKDYVKRMDPSLAADIDAGVPGTYKATAWGVPLTLAWQRDNRDSALVPTRGRYQRVNFEVSPAGDSRYYRATYQQQYFQPLFSATTLALNGEISYGKGM